jgi:hypothetical protein
VPGIQTFLYALCASIIVVTQGLSQQATGSKGLVVAAAADLSWALKEVATS